MKNNININRQPLTQSDIGEAKYFDAVLKKYKSVTTPFYKTKFFLSSIVATSAAVLFTGLYYLGHQASTQANKQPIIYHAPSKTDSTNSQKGDEISFKPLSKPIGKDFNSTTINRVSNGIKLVKQIDITRFFKNPTDQIQLFNDSLAILYNSLHGELSIINLNSNKFITRFIPGDSSLTDHLISITPVAQSIIDSNLHYFRKDRRKVAVSNPLGFSTYFYDGKHIWVGASLSLTEPGDEFNGQPMDYVMRHFFLFQFDNSLKKINKIYALPNPSNKNGIWPDIYNFSMSDSNTIYLRTYSKSNDTLLASYSLNNVNNQLTFQKAYRIKYPDELPKNNENGYPAEYGIRIANGFNGQHIATFSRGLEVLDLNDSTQANLCPKLLDWSKIDTINSILTYCSLDSKQQALVVMFNNSTIEPADNVMMKVNTNRKLYYCFVDKDYNPIENKPLVLTNNGYLVNELPNGTIQLITEDNGEYILKTYKVF